MKRRLHLPLKKEWYNLIESGVKTEEYREIKHHWNVRISKGVNSVRFSYGYTHRVMCFEVKGISVGRGKVEWGAPADKDVYVIKLGKRIL